MPFKSKMQSTPFWATLNILLAFIIFFNAELGRTLGISEIPLSISVVWPSTGFSLAALLLFDISAWPGIFFGNFAYNLYHLFFEGQKTAGTFLAATVISFASLLQALLSNYIIRRFTTPGYFNTVKDLLIFLIPGALLPCLIAPTIGTIALYLLKPGGLFQSFYLWLTFWIGDSMGVFVFTPLIVVWTLKKSTFKIDKNITEFLLMCLIFFLITSLAFFFDFRSFTLLYFPFCIWVAFRFQMLGATLCVFFITLAILIPYSFGQQMIDPNFVGTTLLNQILFLEIIVAVSLLLAAVIQERETALCLLKTHNIDLRQSVEKKSEHLKEKHYEVYIKNKLSSLRLLTSGIALQMQNALQRIDGLSQASLDYLRHLQNSFSSFEKRLGPELFTLFQNSIDVLEKHLSSIIKFEKETKNIAKIIEEQSLLGTSARIKLKPLNINSLLKTCLHSVRTLQYPGFAFDLIEEFDKRVHMLLIFPEDLAHALEYLIRFSIKSLKMKKELLQENFTPELLVKTEEFENYIKITIRNNGLPLTEEQLKNFYLSFLTKGSATLEDSSLIEEQKDLNLILAHDIITFIYRGKIKVIPHHEEHSDILIALPSVPKGLEY